MPAFPDTRKPFLLLHSGLLLAILTGEMEKKFPATNRLLRKPKLPHWRGEQLSDYEVIFTESRLLGQIKH